MRSELEELKRLESLVHPDDNGDSEDRYLHQRRKVYGAGKGQTYRPVDKHLYHSNYDLINWHRQ